MSKEHGQPIQRLYLPADLAIFGQVGTTVASAASIDLENADGDYVVVSGTTTITGIGLEPGHRRLVRFSGALTLTNSATLILPGGVSFTTVAGDMVEFVGEASGVVRATLVSRGLGGSSNVQFKRVTTEFDVDSGSSGTTLTDLVGLTDFQLAAGGVYVLELHINGTATANSGHKIALQLNTATLTSVGYDSQAMLAASTAFTQGTTATSPVPVHGTTSATLGLMIRAVLVVNAAGTMDIQAAQNASHADNTTVFVSSWARLTRIA